MCQFKSGIIFKNRIVLAPEGNESHSSLLESLNIEDTRENAMRIFVRAELLPKDGNKATDVSEWRFRVDQDITPDWYDADPGRYEEDFRDKVREYIGELDTEIDRLESDLEKQMTYNIEACKITETESRLNTIIEVKNDLLGRLNEVI